MGVKKDRRPTFGVGDEFDAQTYSLSGAGALNATRVKRYGVTLITSTGTGTHTLRLEAPERAGIMKTIIASQVSTADVRVQSHSTAVTFGGTTSNTVTFQSSTVASAADKSLVLVSKSTAVWGIVARIPSTAVALTASTLIVA